MWISRIRVTGGFLNGLDVSLSRGLNVVVGPRGAGKTSFLELLRHAVDAQHADQTAAAQRSRQSFLDAVLGSGEVVVDVESEEGGRHLVVDAKGGGQRHDLSSSVLVLGQNELEEIASDAPSRLNLLDLRTGVLSSVPDRTAAASLTGEVFDLRSQLDDLREESRKRERLVSDRELLQSQEMTLLGGNSSLLADQRERLHLAEERVIETGQELKRIAALQGAVKESTSIQNRYADDLNRMASQASSLASGLRVQEALVEAANLSWQAKSALDSAQMELSEVFSNTEQHNLHARSAAAPIRDELEQAEAGLGQITAQLRNVDAALRTLDENDAQVKLLESRLAEAIRLRDSEFDGAEREEESLYERRAGVAQATTSQIANNVVVSVDHLADSGDFRRFLLDSLKRSGTRLAAIESVSERVLPRQLLELIEGHDANGLAAVAKIGVDGAHKLIDNLDDRDILQSLAQVRLADRVDFRLRDGLVDKSVDELSTGQKCAVTLPIVLSEKRRTLILDQPEDHLDNAFLVRNVVSGLISRRDYGAQTVVATHNANIPVLGSADNVIVLTSDGKRGIVDVQAPFDDEEVVDSITRLMEGGRDAFARRSLFYAEHGGIE